MSLNGYYRGTNTKVNTNDEIGRKMAIKVLKEVFNWDLISNTKQFKIDLLHVNKRGGVDVEEGKWVGRYKDQDFVNFNQFTLNHPTANFPARKEKYFNEYFDWVTDNGNLKTYHHPDYKENSLIRFNSDFSEFFFVDYETYNKRIKDLGVWSPNTVYKSDGTGNKIPEYWMCWELKDVDFYYLENDQWIRDTTFDDEVNYKTYLEKYIKSKNKNIK